MRASVIRPPSGRIISHARKAASASRRKNALAPLIPQSEAVLRRYCEMLIDEVTPIQAARIVEIWERICVEQGWRLEL